MRKVILVLFVILLASVAYAEEKEVKYQVTIKVTYNAISIVKAQAIILDALNRYNDACETKVSAKLVDGVDVLTSTGTGAIYASPNFYVTTTDCSK